jgi:thioredoxin-like negative regulator of GroEL
LGLAGLLAMPVGAATTREPLEKAHKLAGEGRQGPAAYYYDRALRAARKQGSEPLVLTSLRGAAESYLSTGVFRLAHARAEELLGRRALAKPDRARFGRLRARAKAARDAFLSAQELHSRGDTGAACRKLVTFADANRGRVERAHFLLVAAAYCSWERELEKKARLCEQVVAEYPDSAFALRAQAVLASVAAKRGKHAEAERIARSMWQRAKSPEGKVTSGLLLASMMKRRGDSAGARRLLAEVRAQASKYEPEADRARVRAAVRKVESER